MLIHLEIYLLIGLIFYSLLTIWMIIKEIDMDVTTDELIRAILLVITWPITVPILISQIIKFKEE